MTTVETRETLKPLRLVLVTGSGGVGKTSLIEGFHTDGRKIYPGLTDFIIAGKVDKDLIANGFTEVRDPSYVKRYRTQSYGQVFQQTEEIIAGGRTALVNASFRLEIGKLGWERRYDELAKKHEAILKIIRLVTAPETLYRRLVARDAITDHHKLVDLETWKAWLQEEPIEMEMPPGSLILTNNGNIGDFPNLVQQAMAFLKE
ncbi:hypothetical protein A3B42_04905 [Candidatus Daviesbacteria bacterium RIFCSPLOWO2_01_FULL_38_10]|nr:MAG: hypothetical protein A3B42_04905 [Candidatus Daviesbacteria bacterium RIFCSPLOWO2_01_FULL_38_10]OGE45749.1 MAG: hypothetical protein A3E67_00660 [Candidatus Daviesbacteria bacterium RIFCSPHIGHO2_12_FULL_38_25]OGE67226.1 MAG: hypothetical protein A3H81_05515 [Candidatus Daviesbacteria bacterium RIFCSPLOWO2_02_FULL_38_18]OGE71771.1 MAG: hypothetical protein A3H18_04980 [Candidatus Daviesbacteria bacterium RIFCSPLOWO2_12_FULL_38_10]